MVAGKNRRDVDVQNVAILENGFLFGNAVTNDVVQTDAGVARISIVAEASRNAAVFFGEVADKFVDFQSIHSGFAHFTCPNQSFCSERARGTDELYFFFGFDFNFGHYPFPCGRLLSYSFQ